VWTSFDSRKKKIIGIEPEAENDGVEMFEQARRLFILHNEADIDYMEKRIRYESGGDYGVANFKD
jgi:hypothetical protein